MIRNTDGSPYQVSGYFRTFDPCNTAERDLFNEFDAEILMITGAPVMYYEVFIDTNNTDPLYREARRKIWSQQPTILYSAYDPITSQNFMNMFGVDSPDELSLEFNYQAVLKALGGRKPKIGSRIFTPHKNENWLVKQVILADWKNWWEIRVQLLCDRFQESLGEDIVTQKEQGYIIN